MDSTAPRSEPLIWRPRRLGLRGKLLLQWEEALRTGIDAVDADHKDLIARFNLMVESLDGQPAAAGFLRHFVDLMDRTRGHFRREERIMRRLGYPRYLSHKEEHRKLMRDARDFLFNLEHVFEEVDFVLVAHYLRHWLLNHVRVEDLPLRDYVETS